MWQILTGMGVSNLDWQNLRLRMALMPVELIASLWAERLIHLVTIPSGIKISYVQQWLASCFMHGSGSLQSQNGALTTVLVGRSYTVFLGTGVYCDLGAQVCVSKLLHVVIQRYNANVVAFGSLIDRADQLTDGDMEAVWAVFDGQKVMSFLPLSSRCALLLDR